MSGGAPSRNWRSSLDGEGVCWFTLDKADSGANTLSAEVLAELTRELEALRVSPPRGLVLESGKRSGFILGADVNEFSQLRDAGQAAEMAARGQAVLGRIAALGAPTVAAIDGFALGGGLELALACDYRVAALSYERTLGLPEVQLGIHPGFGGSVRTVELLGPLAALDLMLTGRSLSPPEALKAGPDGLRDIRELVRLAPAALRGGGLLIFEMGHDQSARVSALVSSTPGLRLLRVVPDLQGYARVCVVQRAPLKQRLACRAEAVCMGGEDGRQAGRYG